MALWVNSVSVDTGTATSCGDLSASNHNVLKFKPPMVFGRNEGNFLLENLESVLQESSMQFVT